MTHTVVAPDLYVPKRHKLFTKARDEFLRANPEVAVAILADAMGFKERAVITYQRKLGIRRLTATLRLGDEGFKSRAGRKFRKRSM